MNIGFYPGSFDPFTNGHLHVVKSASKLFDKVIIGIGINSVKDRRFPKELMEDAIKDCLIEENLSNVNVISYDNLSVDAAISCNCNYIIRGLRNDMDYNYEENIAKINEELSNLDTIYIRSGKYGFISSTMIMDLINNNRDISNYVPNSVVKKLNLKSKNY